LLQGLQAVNARHQHIEQNQVRNWALLQPHQCFFAAGSSDHLVRFDLEQRLQVAQHARFVIHYENCCRLTHVCLSRTPAYVLARAARKGSRNENLLPQPGSLSTQIFPPWAWTRRRAIPKPNPMPDSEFFSSGT